MECFDSKGSPACLDPPDFKCISTFNRDMSYIITNSVTNSVTNFLFTASRELNGILEESVLCKPNSRESFSREFF